MFVVSMIIVVIFKLLTLFRNELLYKLLYEILHIQHLHTGCFSTLNFRTMAATSLLVKVITDTQKILIILDHINLEAINKI